MQNHSLSHGGPNIDRRSAIRLLLGSSALVASLGTTIPAVPALADTQSELDAAQAQYDEAQKQFSQIADEYEQLSKKQSDTLDEIESITSQIGELQSEIDQTTSDLSKKQKQLSGTVSDQYKDGSHGVVDVVLGSQSVEDLISNLRSYDKITETNAQLIATVKEERSKLQSDQQRLQDHKTELEAQQATQQDQLEQMRSKQDEAQQLVDGLDQQVKDLIAQRDEELLAAQEEAKRAAEERAQQEQAAKEKAAQEAAARQAEAEAAAAASASANQGSSANASSDESDSQSSATSASSASDDAGSSSTSGSSTSTGSQSSSAAATGSAAAIVASCKSTPSPGGGLCAAWVSNVFTNAGYGFIGGNACDMYNAYATYSDRSQLKPGMIVAVSTHPHTSAGRIYGHIGIYIGNGQLMENVGTIRTSSIDWWCSYYGATVTPRWGWLGGIVLG